MIDRGEVLGEVHPRARRRLLAELAAAGVQLCREAEVAEVARDHVRLTNGRQIAAAFTLGVAGARPHRWLEGAA